MVRSPLMRRPLIGFGTMALFALVLGGSPVAAQQAGGATKVGVVTLETAQVPYSVTLPGRAVAFEEVDIRPRVAGMISEIVYEAGRKVAKGDVLFRIDGDSYAADVAAAEAELESAKASVSAAEATLKRYEGLAGTGVTAEDVESARVTWLQAKATQSSAEAALDVAKLDLERTEITSPIDGVAEVAEVSVGDIVTANQTDALTTVTRLDPIFVDVEESSKSLLQVRDRIEAGSLERGDNLQISLQLETGATYSGEGVLVSPGVRVSTTTGTTVLRMRFDNPDRVILPGQFLRVDVTLGSTSAILVPQRATSRAADGTLTAFVVENDTAVKRTLEEHGESDNSWIVTSGVSAGETLIVDGLTNLRDGASVETVPVTISETGVVAATDGSDASFGSTSDEN